MVYPCDGVPRPGLEVPGMVCPECGHGRVYWLDGHGAWCLDAPLPHFSCNWCGNLFHADYPHQSKQYQQAHAPNVSRLWGAA